MALRTATLTFALFAVPTLALAWTSGSPFSATVHGHQFTKVAGHNDGCSVKTALEFTAPEASYQDTEAVRNYYRFRARARFASGKEAVSPIFFSQKAGTHRFEFSVDTSQASCWGQAEQKVIGVDVEGCRGKGCSVEPFQN